MKHRRALAAAVALAAVAALPRAASSSGTQYWELTTRDAVAEGESFEGLVLTAEGELRAGVAAEATVVEGERQVWSLLRAKDGAVLAGTASGKILRLDGGKVANAFATGELLVTALVEGPDGLAYAATLPAGKVFRRDAAGAWSLFATLPCKYVWALLPHPGYHLVAATGPEGKLMAVDAQGKAEVLCETGKENVLSLAAGEGRELYFGTATPGLLFRLPPGGKPSIVRDFGENEVRVIRVRRGGLAVGLNSGVKVAPSAFLGAVQQAAQKAESKEGAPPADSGGGGAAPAAKPGGDGGGKPVAVSSAAPAATVRGAVALLSPEGRLERQVEYPSSYVTDLAVTEAGIVVGTNNSGRVHRIDDRGRSALLWDFPQGQVLAFASDGGRVALAGTGDPAAVQRLGDGPAADGRYRSKVFDAKVLAEWGSLAWRGRGRVAFRTRSGNVAEPDKTWTDWAPAAAADPAVPSCLRVASPRGRYLQLQAAWEGDAEAVVAGVSVAYLPENQRPRALEVKVVSAPPPGQPAPVVGAPSQNQPALPVALHATHKKITWRAEDPDGDPLVFRLAYRAEDGTAWIPLHRDQPVGGAEYLWSTESVPDGRYVMRVEASDEAANAEERALRDARECVPFCIDHRKPEVVLEAARDGGALRVKGRATDALSPIARLEYAVDGGDWRTLFPVDRIFDMRIEAFEFAPGDLPPGAHVVTVRAVDVENNVGSAALAVTVP
jgi:hypothetical protein